MHFVIRMINKNYMFIHIFLKNFWINKWIILKFQNYGFTNKGKGVCSR